MAAGEAINLNTIIIINISGNKVCKGGRSIHRKNDRGSVTSVQEKIVSVKSKANDKFAFLTKNFVTPDCSKALIMPFSRHLQVISEGTSSPAAIFELIKSPSFPPDFLSARSKSPALKWTQPSRRSCSNWH
mmetsp:Transcript_30179/g.72431  ORF Transcript_30179/g.72431 Transcript_30179/m.72431 type:complete len:131 (+) Transcript_30179:2218-2610(+)